MRCPKCGSDDVTIVTAPNGFGTWLCDTCNAFGSYPPEQSATVAPTVIGGSPFEE